MVKIAEAISGEGHCEQIKSLLQKVVQTTKNDSVRAKAQKVLKGLDKLKVEAED